MASPYHHLLRWDISGWKNMGFKSPVRECQIINDKNQEIELIEKYDTKGNLLTYKEFKRDEYRLIYNNEGVEAIYYRNENILKDCTLIKMSFPFEKEEEYSYLSGEKISGMC